jgi:hypothetical protein
MSANFLTSQGIYDYIRTYQTFGRLTLRQQQAGIIRMCLRSVVPAIAFDISFAEGLTVRCLSSAEFLAPCLIFLYVHILGMWI